MKNHKKTFIILEASKLIKQHEGWRGHAYNDADGVELKQHSLENSGTVTFGYGFNLSTSGPEMPPEVAELWLNKYLLPQIHDFIFEISNDLPICVHVALMDMAYNLGRSGFLGFKDTIELLKGGNFELASRAMLESTWATQVESRAIKLSLMVLSPENKIDKYSIHMEYKAAFYGYQLAKNGPA